MNTKCPHCNTPLSIPDHKIPRDREASFKCPKCQNKIQVSALTNGQGGQKEEAAFMDPGIFSGQGQGQAMVCMTDIPTRTKVLAACSQAGFEVHTPESIVAALKKMAYHLYPLVVVDETQGFKSIATYMNELDMSLRRRICWVLVSQTLSTGDLGAALHASVNSIVGPDGLDHLNTLLPRILKDHAELYKVFNESMKAAGKA